MNNNLENQQPTRVIDLNPERTFTVWYMNNTGVDAFTDIKASSQAEAYRKFNSTSTDCKYIISVK